MNSRGLRFTTFHVRFTTFHVGPPEAIPPETKLNTTITCALRAPASDAGISPFDIPIV